MRVRPLSFRPLGSRGSRRAGAAALALATVGLLASAGPAAADTDTFLDATGDALSPVDIVSYSVTLNAATFAVTVHLASWDAAVAADSIFTMKIETDFDTAEPEFSISKSGTAAARLIQNSAEVPGCTVAESPSPTDHTLTYSVDATCLDSPAWVSVSILLMGESLPVSGGTDYAPDFYEYSRPVTSGDESGLDLPVAPVYRFWSAGFNNAHFFTTSETEAIHVYTSDTNWAFEGVAFSAYAPDGTTCPGAAPVYRFYSPVFQSHFYTQNEAEKQHIQQYDRNWNYEGIAYCALPTEQPGTTALYRFWSPGFGKHFYTANPAEAKQLDVNDPNWDYEGVAFYVLP